MISANNFIIHKSRKQAFFNDSIVCHCLKLAVCFFCGVFFRYVKFWNMEKAPIERNSRCMQKITATRYPLKFNLHKKQFVSLCFLFLFLSFFHSFLPFSRFGIRVARMSHFFAIFVCIFFNFQTIRPTTNYVIILYFI